MNKYATFGFLFFVLIQLHAQVWKSLGPCGSATYGNHVASQGGTGQIHAITFDPDSPEIVYCGSPFGGLWKSYSGGKIWSNEGIDNTQAMEFSSVSDIAITKSDGTKTLWVSTGHPGARGDVGRGLEPYSCGLYKSDDGGKTFTPVTSFNSRFRFTVPNKKHISKLTAHPYNANIMYAATSDGLYQTTNAGKSWRLVLKETEFAGSTPYTKGVFSVEFSVVNPDKVVYASGSDVYVSVKSGRKNSFKTLTHHLADLLRESADCINDFNLNIEVNAEANHDVLYSATYIRGDTCGALKNRTDYGFFFFDGKNWIRKTSPPMSSLVDGIRIKLASVLGKPNLVYAGSGVTSVSNDYGNTWKQATDYNQPGHADIHAIEIVPGTNDMITGTDGGIFRYDFETGKVDEYNNGLCISKVIDMGASHDTSNRVLIGLQDVGANIWDGKEWTKIPSGGDGYYPQHIDYFDPKKIFSCHNFSFLSRENEAEALRNSSNCTGGCPYAFAQNTVVPSVFYYGSKDVYKSTDGTKTWCRISDFAKSGAYINPAGHVINNIEIAPSNQDVMYVSFNAFPDCCNSLLFKTNSGGDSCSGNCTSPRTSTRWTQLNIPQVKTANATSDFIANSYHNISSIAISDKDSEHIWLAYNFSDLRDRSFTVFKSTDGGETWIKDDDGLPFYPVTKLAYVRNNNGLLLAGTWQGVYYKRGTDPWKKLGHNFPRVYVSDIEVHPLTGKIRVATFGRGVWETEIP